jgi:hypothetical protein
MDAPPQQPQPPPDCLICFGPIRRKLPPWQQPTPIPCDCRPLIHRTCWDAWAAQAGPVCIICRSNKHYPALPPQPPFQVRRGVLFLFLPADRDPCSSILVLVFVFYLLLTAYHTFQQANARPRITDPPEWYPPRRLEL